MLTPCYLTAELFTNLLLLKFYLALMFKKLLLLFLS